MAPGQIMEQIRAAIRESRVCAADITTANANVLYELGLAEALGKPIIIIGQTGSVPPFDIASRRYIAYDPANPMTAIDTVTAALSLQLERGRLDEAEALIENGHCRAAVAILGVILEHALHLALRSTDITSDRRLYSAIQMSNALATRNVIEPSDLAAVKQFSQIRNRAVHELAEPSGDEARLAQELLRRIFGATGY